MIVSCGIFPSLTASMLASGLLNSARPTEFLPLTETSRGDGKSLSPQHQHALACQSFRTSLLTDRVVLDINHGRKVVLPDQRGRSPKTAGPFQSRASRQRTRHRLPLLPHERGEVSFRRHSRDANLHELPFADLVR